MVLLKVGEQRLKVHLPAEQNRLDLLQLILLPNVQQTLKNAQQLKADVRNQNQHHWNRSEVPFRKNESVGEFQKLQEIPVGWAEVEEISHHKRSY